MGILRDCLFTSIAAAVLMAFSVFDGGHCQSHNRSLLLLCEGNIMTVAGCSPLSTNES